MDISDVCLKQNCQIKHDTGFLQKGKNVTDLWNDCTEQVMKARGFKKISWNWN